MRYLHPADRNPVIITNPDKDVSKKLDLKDIEFLLKIRDIHKIDEHNFISIRVFGCGDIQSMYEKNTVKKKHVDLLLRRGEGKRYYVLIKEINTFMYDHTLHCGRNIKMSY